MCACSDHVCTCERVCMLLYRVCVFIVCEGKLYVFTRVERVSILSVFRSFMYPVCAFCSEYYIEFIKV